MWFVDLDWTFPGVHGRLAGSNYACALRGTAPSARWRLIVPKTDSATNAAARSRACPALFPSGRFSRQVPGNRGVNHFAAQLGKHPSRL